MADAPHAVDTPTLSGRGPQDHPTRDQIIVAANECFSHFGYSKTTVSDLAEAIGYSKAYIYRFFESKQAIGDAVVAQCVGRITDEIAALVASEQTPVDKLRGIVAILINRGRQSYFDDRRLHDIVIVATAEDWPAVRRYVERMAELVRAVILQGRETGDFERKTPLDETIRGLLAVLRQFMHPVMLEQNLAVLDVNALATTNLLLRSLAP